MRSRTLREGSVGLLILAFAVTCAGLFVWLRGIGLGRRNYNIVVEFDNANSLKTGATVRYRGIDIGKVAQIQPTSNGVDVTIEVEKVDLRIPKDVAVEVNQAGFVGESSIDINPQSALPKNTLTESATSGECNGEIIVCENDRLQGNSGASFQEFISGTVALTNKLNEQEFFVSLSEATENAAIAAEKVSELSGELKLLSSSVRQEVKGFSGTSDSINQVAAVATQKIDLAGDEITASATEFKELANNINSLIVDVNGLVSENRGTIVTTLDEISQTSRELRVLATNLNPVVDKVNANLDGLNTQELVQNLSTLTANAATAADNFRQVSESFNNPTNLVVLQQTLDSARATFANAQKITSDLDQLTGSPEFRDNVRDLVNGLSNLVSSTEELEQLVETAQTLDSVEEVAEDDENNDTQELVADPEDLSEQPPSPAVSSYIKKAKSVSNE